MTEKIFAFWTNDSFPFVVSDSVTPLDDGVMKTDRYGQFGTSSVIAYRPLKQGAEIQEKLRVLDTELHKKIFELKKEYEGKALEILPELALSKKFGGKIR